MSEIGGGGGSVESSGSGEVSSSSEVSETSSAETGGESSEATQEATTEEAGESGGFDEASDTTESPEDSAEDSDESEYDEEPDDSQEVGFSEGDDVDNPDSQNDESEYEDSDSSDADENGVGFDDSDDDCDISNGVEPDDTDDETEADNIDNDQDEGDHTEAPDSIDAGDEAEDELDGNDDFEDQDNEYDLGEPEDYSDEDTLDDPSDGDEANDDVDGDGNPDDADSDSVTDTGDNDNIDNNEDENDHTEDSDSTDGNDNVDGDNIPNDADSDSVVDTGDNDNIDNDWDAQNDEDSGEPEDYSNEDTLDNTSDDYVDGDGAPDDADSDTETDTEGNDNIDNNEDENDHTEDPDSTDGNDDVDDDNISNDADSDSVADTEDYNSIDGNLDEGDDTENHDSTDNSNEINVDTDDDSTPDDADSDTEDNTEDHDSIDDDYDEDEDPGEVEQYSEEDLDNHNEADDSTDEDSEAERKQEDEEQVVEEENRESADRAENETENADAENTVKNGEANAESESQNLPENIAESQNEPVTTENGNNEVDTENNASRVDGNDAAIEVTDIHTESAANNEGNSSENRDQNEERPEDANAKLDNTVENPDNEDAHRTAMKNMADYMSEHNYGRDDYAEYSKDPEWQKLNADLQKSLGMEVTTDTTAHSPESGKEVSAPELSDNCVMVNASDIDMTYAQGMDSEQFWNHHGNTKEDYMRMAERIPDVQQALDSGKSLDEIKQDPELKDTAHAYFDPENMIKVEQQADGSYSFADDGRHRIAAAQELGYEIPVDVAKTGNNVEPQGDTKTSDSPSENQNALAGDDGPDNPPLPDGDDGPGGPPEKEFGKEQLNVAAHGDDPSWVKSSDIKNKLDDIGCSDLSAKVDEAIGKLKSGDPKASEDFISTMREAGNELCKNEDTADCGNALLNLVDKDEQALKVEAEDGTQEFNGLEQENNERVEGVKEITQHYYDDARTLAQNSDVGRDFTDHTEAHVEQVAEKSLETADALESAIEKGEFQIENPDADHINFVGNIDKSVLEGAALSHDTGMSGNGYALEYKVDENGKKQFIKDEDGNYIVKNEDNNNFNEVRENHSLNSAVNVLTDREKYKELGYSDSQIDMMAAECMAHSKSSSGVANLNSKSDWSDCFDRIDATVAKYNEDHSDSPITFDRTQFESNDEKLGQLATSTLALRVGDVSRDSGPEAISQSGEKVYVDRDTLNDNGGSVKEELSGADITRGENHETIDSTKSRQVHTGEQNITENHTTCDANGNVNHEITVNDGNSAPKCTQDAISDHLGEFASAKGGYFNIEVKFDSPCSPESKASYEDFRKQIEGNSKYDNISITYPWDKEE